MPWAPRRGPRRGAEEVVGAGRVERPVAGLLGTHRVAPEVTIQQPRGAAERVEAELGPIDIWVNDAMTTVLAELTHITADERMLCL